MQKIITKARSVAQGVVALLISIVFGGMFLATSLSSQSNQELSVFAFLIPLVVALMTELSAVNLRKAFSAQEIGEFSTPGIAPQNVLVAPLRALSIFSHWTGLLVGLLVAVGVTIFVVMYLGGVEPVFGTLFYVQVATYIAYFVLKPVVMKAMLPLRRYVKSKTMLYTFDANSLTLDLRIVDFSKSGKFEPIRIGFDELDEIEVMEWPQAQQYARNSMGANVVTGWRAFMDFNRYLGGNLKRPAVWENIGSNGKTLLLRGPKLLYLVTVSNEDIASLIGAFHQFKGGSQV